MAKMYVQSSSEHGQVTLEVDAPVNELAAIPQKLKAMGLPQVEGEFRVQLEGTVSVGSRNQKIVVNCGSNSLALLLQKLEPFILEE